MRKISIHEQFYVVSNGGEEVKNVRAKHKDVKKSFDSKTAKEYLSENRIRSTKDLISFVSFLDSRSK